MTLERIENHIIEKAETEAEAIAHEAAEEAGRITGSAREEADAAFHAAIEQAKSQLSAEFEKALGQARTAGRMELLKRKSAILYDIFAKTAERLIANEEYWKCLREQLKGLAGQKGTILCAADHREKIAEMIKELNGELSEKVPSAAKEPADISGGFILTGDEYDVDFSLDSQLEALREKILPELIAKAFPED